jgi:hypothetical protein
MMRAMDTFEIDNRIHYTTDGGRTWSCYDNAGPMGAWPDNPASPCGYDERDAKGV